MNSGANLKCRASSSLFMRMYVCMLVVDLGDFALVWSCLMVYLTEVDT